MMTCYDFTQNKETVNSRHWRVKPSVLLPTSQNVSKDNTYTHTQSGLDTLATRPCSRQCCSSSLSLVMGVRGLTSMKGAENGRIKDENGSDLCWKSASERCVQDVRFITWTCLAGSPRNSEHGARQRPPWHQS